jgi:hypothetical protein
MCAYVNCAALACRRRAFADKMWKVVAPTEREGWVTVDDSIIPFMNVYNLQVDK